VRVETFLAILLIAALALAATSRLGFRLRRWRVTTALIGGGWMGIAAGAAIGPHGLGAVTPETVRAVTPLVVLGLGWIGLMVGLQASARVLRQVPTPAMRVFVIDALLSVAAFGALGWFGVRAWTGGETADAASGLWLMSALVACASLGWAMETRSLARGEEAAWRAGTATVRGAGGLASIAAILVFGVAFATTHETSEQARASELPPAGLAAARVVVTALLGVAAGLLGRFALGEAGGSRGQSLAVVLGLVALVGGLAFEMDLSPLLVAGVAGAVMSNLAGTALRSFERTILKAEHASAVVFTILAGVLLDPAIGWGGAALAALIAALRVAIKPVALRAGAGGGAELGTLALASVRQSPIAVALGVALVVSTQDPTAQRLLTVLVLAGLLAQLAPTAASWRLRGSPMGTAVESETRAPGETA
jgi:hypothetical protein